MYIKVNATPTNESFLRGVVSAFAARANPTMEVISDIKTAVSEAVTNVIVHAYADRDTGEIEVRASIDEGVLTVEITDRGAGIPNINEALKDFFTTRADEERSGLGFTIMAGFMDSLNVTSQSGAGTTVTMTKKLA